MPHSIPEDTPVPDDMDVEPTPLDVEDIMDEETMDELLRSPRDGRSNQSTSSTATAKELRALPPPSPMKREHSPTDAGITNEEEQNNRQGCPDVGEDLIHVRQR